MSDEQNCNIAWRFTGIAGFKRYVTQEQYEAFLPEVKRWYEPYSCENCRIDDNPAYGIIDPDYARVFTKARCLAWQEGYALMMHGSFTRDLDLICVPWEENAREPESLIARIMDSCDLKMVGKEPTLKPHNRLVWTLMFKEFGDPRFIDIGIIKPTKKE